MHTQPADQELQHQIWAVFHKYESCIDAEIQQRANEYLALSTRGPALMDVLAEMPKFPVRESALIKKAEDAEVDNAEQSAIKLRAKQQTSNALVVANPFPANGPSPAVSAQLGMVKVPGISNNERLTGSHDVTPSPDALRDLLSPLATEVPQSAPVQSEEAMPAGQETVSEAIDVLALAPVEAQTNTVQPIGNITERFQDLCLKDSGVLYEDPHIQIGVKAEWRLQYGRLVLFLGNKSTSPLVSVQAFILPPVHLKMELSQVPDAIPPCAQIQCPLEVVNLLPSRDIAVLDFSYKFSTSLVNVNLRLPAVLNKFMLPISVSAEDFFPQWRSLSGPPLKLQEVVRGVRPMPLLQMLNLLDSYRLMVCLGLDPNPNNIIACSTFFSDATRTMLCLIRIETDPADRTQLRLTVASGNPTLTFELKEFIKELLIFIPVDTQSSALQSSNPAGILSPAQPTSPPAPRTPSASIDPGFMLAGMLS